MATETIKKRALSINVENGTDEEGNIKLASVSMGKIAKDRWDGDKALAIVEALKPCLNNTVANVETVATSTLTPGS